MEYHPRHAQPFTLTEAVLLPLDTITDEIARLENSLKHLRETQEELKQNVEGLDAPDPEFCQAFEENENVIGSQEERITILEMALEQKGIVSARSAHYVGSPPTQRAGDAQQQPSPSAPEPTEPTGDEEGVML
ncbi:hypothetical protein EWM64_g4143 [Hericium alpestre]|uniref:Uncharacterized protein n=1 Tax=Hericium alpestre TaxID=135208 RepID=A0A4Z0A0K6_9AGAM|nr:hypothetical protein EWM64_g4143 [Hericium alpestre]